MTASKDERAGLSGVANSKNVISFGDSVLLVGDIRSIRIFASQGDTAASVVVDVGPDQAVHQFSLEDDTSARAEFDRIKYLWEDHCNQYETE